MRNGRRAPALPLGPAPGVSRGYSSGRHAVGVGDGGIEGAAVVAAHGGTVGRVLSCGRQHHGSGHTRHGFGTGVVVCGEDGRSCRHAHVRAGGVPIVLSSGRAR